MRGSRRDAALLLAAAAILALPAQVRAQDGPFEFVPRATRNVTPPGMTPGPEVEGPLYRDPLPPPPEDPPKWRRIFLPETTDAATLHTSTLVIRVSGVDPVPVQRVCERADGETWPCGQTALVSLRRFLGGRPVDCYFPAVAVGTEVTAPCRVGQTDLGEWLLSQGWGTPNDYATDAYRAAALRGRCDRQGIWRGMEGSEAGCPAP